MSGPPSSRPTRPATTATSATMATNSPGCMEMSATDSAVARSARLPCRSSASSTADMVRLPMSDTLRGFWMPSRALETRCRGNSSSPTRNRPAKMPDRSQPQRAVTNRTPLPASAVRRSRRTASTPWSAAPRVVGGTVVVGAAVVVGVAVVVGAGGRRRRPWRHGGGSTTGVSRSATRANAAETPAASSAEVTLPSAWRLARSVSGRRQADGLDVLTLDGRDGCVQRARCCRRPCRRTASRAPCARPPA